MSTFKRLFNVGKGSAKVAGRDLAESLDGAREASGEWVDSARHRAADAVEALAGALRPSDRITPEPAPERDPDVDSDPIAGRQARPATPADEAPPRAAGPRKRTL